MINPFQNTSNIKIALVVAAIVIAAASLVSSHLLVKDLAVEERNRMEVWAEAMRSLNNADENTDLSLVLKVIDGNNNIPVIVTDSKGMVQTMRNIEMNFASPQDSIETLTRLAHSMMQSGNKIRIDLDNAEGDDDHIIVCYDESFLIKRLAIYPYIQLTVVVIFVVITLLALLAMKKAEQNKVWVGLSKETAHQLGTPISSLMAWTEILRETYPDDDLIPEMDKDVKRLQLIAERFSKIGSLPEPQDTELRLMLTHLVDYMNRRTSEKVQIVDEFSQCDAHVMVNPSLFEWVLENLCKNAVDAMDGKGRIVITASVSESHPSNVVIDLEDNGKGIEKKHIKTVFKPGFTTKKRGWGLGLSLAKRIVEEYHNGKIFVLRSEVGVGTTFRIIVPLK